jgi:hypothetical protein
LEADEFVMVLLVVVRRGPVVLVDRVSGRDVERRVGRGRDLEGREPRERGRGEDEAEAEVGRAGGVETRWIQILNQRYIHGGGKSHPP